MTDGLSGPIIPNTLAGLADVQLTNLQNNNILVYNASIKKWVNSPTIPVTAGVESINGLAGVLTLNSANAGIAVSSAVSTIQLTLGELSYGTLAGKAITITSLATNNVLQYNGTAWVNATIAAGVSSVNGQTGAVLPTTPNSTLTYGTSGGSTVTTDINLGHANTWTAAQTFTNSDLLLLGSSTGYTTFTSANSSGTNYTATFPANTGTVAELNLAQTWSALQTFGTEASFFGTALSGTIGSSGYVLTYNGSNLVMAAIPASTAIAWSSITAPTTTAGFTAPAGDETTITVQSTTQTGWTFTSSTLTSGMLLAANLTGSSAFTGSIVSIASTGTGLTSTTATGLAVALSGVNSNTAVTATGLSVSVSNTNATSGTNRALYLSASGATTANYALYINSGTSLFGGNVVPSANASYNLGSAAIQWAFVYAVDVFGSAALFVGSNATANGITTSSQGASSTTLYIGNASILTSASDVPWSSLTNPTTTAGFTAPAGDETTITVQSTTQTGWTFTSSTLTSGKLLAANLTGSSAFTGSIVSIASTGTGLTSTTATGLTVALSGVNSNTAVTATGLSVSVSNTNATSGTNTALELSASGATTANYALYINSGTSVFGGNVVPSANSSYNLGSNAIQWGFVYATDVFGSAALFVGSNATANGITTSSQGASSTTLYIGNASILTSGSIFTKYNNIATVGNGVPSNYGSTLTTPVALGTGSTAIKSYTPVTAGQFLVVVSVVSAASSITGTLTVTYTDPTVGGTATQSQSIAAISSGAGETYIFLRNATTATAISVAGTASTGSDLHASASIFAL